jgi:hypothetical protein
LSITTGIPMKRDSVCSPSLVRVGEDTLGNRYADAHIAPCLGGSSCGPPNACFVVQRPAEGVFNLKVNLDGAKALSLMIPQAIPMRADVVIS